MLNYEYPPLGGGAAPVTKELSENLVSQGNKVDLVTMGYKKLPKKENINGVNIYRVPCLRSKESICHPHEMASFIKPAIKKSEELIEKNNYDIIHTHFIIPTGMVSYFLKKKYNIPYVITVHGSDVPGYNPDRFNFLHPIINPLWKKIVSNSSKIISPSNYLKKLIKKTYSKADVEVIPNGFNYKKYNPKRKKEKRILVTSRLFERKGVQYFLDALSKTDLPSDWKITITGEGPYKEKLEEKAKKLNLDINFTGWIKRDELKDLLETSQIYVFPSSHENCPVSLQEAMASGNAIIASNRSGTSEVIGNAGIKLNPKNIKRLRKSIEILIENEEKRKNLMEEAYNRVKNKHNWGKISDLYIGVFNEA